MTLWFDEPIPHDSCPIRQCKFEFRNFLNGSECRTQTKIRCQDNNMISEESFRKFICSFNCELCAHTNVKFIRHRIYEGPHNSASQSSMRSITAKRLKLYSVMFFLCRLVGWKCVLSACAAQPLASVIYTLNIWKYFLTHLTHPQITYYNHMNVWRDNSALKLHAWLAHEWARASELKLL